MLYRRDFLKNAFAYSAVPSLVSLSFPLGSTELAEAFSSSRLEGLTSVALVDLETRKTIEGYNQFEKLPLASVTKALTASYSLETIGPAYNFATKVYSDSLPRDGKVFGNIYLLGGGDPSLTVDDLFSLVKNLKKLGVNEIKGDFSMAKSYYKKAIEIDNNYTPSLNSLNSLD